LINQNSADIDRPKLVLYFPKPSGRSPDA